MQTSSRALARLLLTAYVVVLAMILFQPSAGAAIETVGGLTDLLRKLGIPESVVNGYRVEFVLNALMFAPVPFLGAWVFPGLRWSDWVAWTFIGSGLVEITQGLFFPARSAQFVDIVANTLGGLMGAVPAMVVLGLLSRRAGRAANSEPSALSGTADLPS